MLKLQYITKSDQPFWYTLDPRLSESEFDLKIQDRRAYVIKDDDTPIGIMRYNLFWDRIPFLNHIKLMEPARGKGFGKQALLFWEAEMRALGHPMVMLSTQVDEEAQHFYRPLGYQDKGVLFFDNTPFEQAGELFMVKVF